MSYRIYKFGSTTLPSTRLEGTFGTGADVDSGVQTVGGMLDTRGDGYATLRVPYDVVYSAWVYNAAEATAMTQFKALSALRGTRAKLYRINEYDSTEHWAYARLMQVQAPWQYQRRTMQPVSLLFQLLTPWYEDATAGDPWVLDDGEVLDDGLYLDESGALTYTLDAGSGNANAISVRNNGNAVSYYASLAITAGTNAITVATIQGPYSKFTWTGTVASGKVLVIDCRNRTVTNDGVNAYSGLALDTTHYIDYWLQLPPDSWAGITITLTGGSTDSELTLTYAHAWN